MNAQFPDLQPTLTGDRVLIRPITAEDWPAMFAAASDPKVWELHPARDRYTEPVFRKYFDGAMASGSAFAFVDLIRNTVMGSSRYHGYNAVPGEIEIGWTFLTRDYWGGSYNREIKRLMVNHAFTFADTVVFWVGETNWRSQRAMEKIGGVRRPGRFARPLTGPDQYSVIYEIRKGAFV